MCHMLVPAVYFSNNNAPTRCAGRENITGLLRTVCVTRIRTLTVPKMNSLGYNSTVFIIITLDILGLYKINICSIISIHETNM